MFAFVTNFDMQMLAVLVAAACALPGAFLVLRRMALITDAISHVILLGIVLAYFIVRDLKSPFLLVGAAIGGVATVALVELLQRTKLVKEDAAIGLVYPALFSVAVLLVTMKAANVHLDVDAALVGHLSFAASRKVQMTATSEMPLSSLVMAVVLTLNVAFIAACYKELKITTFDAALAASLGFMPVLLNYVLMTLVSLTAVTAFDAVGAVLVVPMMIVPAATALLLTNRLAEVLALSVLVAIGAALGGFWLATWANANYAGAIAVVLGLEFAVAWIAAPRRGLIAGRLRRRHQYREFLETLLAIHLLHHEGTPAESEESALAGLHRHLRWPQKQVNRVVGWATGDELMEARDGQLVLTATGRELARHMLGQAHVG